MIARRSFRVALWIGLAFASVGAMAAEPSATSFVEAIYAPYKVKNGKGIPLDSDAAVKRYFEPRLAALIIKDRNKAGGELSGSVHRCPGLGHQRRRRSRPRYRR